MEIDMYVRPPNTNRQKIKIPENYSGNAFTQSPKPSDMPPPVRQIHPRYDLPYEELGKVDEITESEPNTEQEAEFERDLSYSKEIPEQSLLNERPNEEKSLLPTSVAPKKESRGSIFSSLLPPGINFSSHFPFGHGIGSEEIIILAVMLLVYLSGADDEDHDHELILLLGLLLLAG